MQLSTKEAEQIFNKLKIEPKHSTHHVAGFLTVNGVKILPLHYSRGNKDLPGNVPHKFRKSMKLSLEEFEEMKKCYMSREEYINILTAKGIIK